LKGVSAAAGRTKVHFPVSYVPNDLLFRGGQEKEIDGGFVPALLYAILIATWSLLQGRANGRLLCARAVGMARISQVNQR
jgi:hypothetical protein